MKKFLSMTLCLLMLLGLVGCGSGADGKTGADGITPTIGANGNWWVGDTDTGVKAEGEDGVGIKNVSAQLETDPVTGETYVNFTYEMSDGTVKTVSIPYTQETYLIPQPVASDYYNGKRAVFIGTSTTCGVGASSEEKNYVNQLAKLLGLASFDNKGVSGAVMATGSVRGSNIGNLSLENCFRADLVLIQMGGNDFSEATKDGVYHCEQKFDDGRNVHEMGEFLSDDTTTIYGAMKMWCEKVVELRKTEGCKDTKFFFITPFGTRRNVSATMDYSSDQNAVNIHGIKMRDICEAMIKTCDYYKIPVLDLNLYGGLYHKNASDSTLSGNMASDGIHLNDAGHTMFAENLYRMLLVNPTYVGADEARKYLISGVDAYAEVGLKANPVPTITYNTNGFGTTPASMDARRLPMVLPILDDQAGFTFGGWYKDKNCTIPATPGEVICSDITLYAKWS